MSWRRLPGWHCKGGEDGFVHCLCRRLQFRCLLADVLLAEEMNWGEGDRIFLAASRFDPTEAEAAVVNRVSGRTLALEDPLAFTHFGAPSASLVNGTAVRSICGDKTRQRVVCAHLLAAAKERVTQGERKSLCRSVCLDSARL